MKQTVILSNEKLTECWELYQSVLSVKAIGIVNQMVIQSVSQSFNQSFDHLVIYSFDKAGLIILFM